MFMAKNILRKTLKKNLWLPKKEEAAWKAIKSSDGKDWFKKSDTEFKCISDGATYYFNEQKYETKAMHNEHGPAKISAWGEKYWWLNGVQYSETKFNNLMAAKKLDKSKVASNKKDEWKEEPNTDSFKKWFKKSDTEYKCISYGDTYFFNSKNFKDGSLHNENGPAIIRQNGTKFWYLNGKHITEKEFKTMAAKKDVADKEGYKLLKYSPDGRKWYKKSNKEYKCVDGGYTYYFNKKDFASANIHNENGHAFISPYVKEYWLNGKATTKANVDKLIAAKKDAVVPAKKVSVKKDEWVNLGKENYYDSTWFQFGDQQQFKTVSDNGKDVLYFNKKERRFCTYSLTDFTCKN